MEVNLLDQHRKTEHYAQKINELPAFPAVVSGIIRLIENPLTSMNRIEELMTKDQGLTLKTLRMANSAFYSIPGGAKTLNRAITHLGLESIKQIVLTSTVYELLSTKSNSKFDVGLYWKHSIYTGSVAGLLAQKFNLGKSSDVFICGLVHDMGKVLLNMVDAKSYAETVKLSEETGVHFDEAEKTLDTPRHTHIGMMVAKKWSLPAVIQCCINDHHTERLTTRESTVPEINSVVDAVWLANRMIENMMLDKNGKIQPYTYESEVLKRCEIELKDLEALQPEIEVAIASSESLLKTLS